MSTKEAQLRAWRKYNQTHKKMVITFSPEYSQKLAVHIKKNPTFVQSVRKWVEELLDKDGKIIA